MARPASLAEFAAIAELQAIFDGHASRRVSAKPSASRRAAAKPSASRLVQRDESSRARIELSIGDDAAVLVPPGRVVWTVDTAVEHVHFERGWLSLADLGWRSFHAAASDVCAMAGKPWCALSSVIFPAGFSARELRELARGQRDAAIQLGCRIVGGNLARGAELSVTTTVLGTAAHPLLRSGAQVGDELWFAERSGWLRPGSAYFNAAGCSKPAPRAACCRRFGGPKRSSRSASRSRAAPTPRSTYPTAYAVTRLTWHAPAKSAW